MDRYCKIPVTEMTNKDKIHAMASHLYQILVTFKYACKRSLKPEAYAEVISEIGETPETDNVFLKD